MEHSHAIKEMHRLERDIHKLTAENVELSIRIKELEAQNQRLRDFELRTYDGLSQQAGYAEALATALRAFVMDDAIYYVVSQGTIDRAREVLARYEEACK